MVEIIQMKALWTELSFGAVYYAGQGGSYFQSLDWILRGDHFNQWNWVTEQYFPVVLSRERKSFIE